MNDSRTRRQATLFLRNAPAIEILRGRHNPRQAKLIAAHVTLCREDEVTDWGEIAARLAVPPPAVMLSFGPPERNGSLVYLPGADIDGSFQALRRHLLTPAAVRVHEPHITLIHPRNGHCDDAVWQAIRTKIEPFTYTFSEVSLILQKDGGMWRTLQNFPLDNSR